MLQELAFILFRPEEWLLLLGAVAVFAIIAQRDFQRYKLQKAAIEKGLSVLPTGAPLWLATLKKGILVLAFGAALVIVGAVGLATLPDPKTMPQPATNPGPLAPRDRLRPPPGPDGRPLPGDFPPPQDFRPGEPMGNAPDPQRPELRRPDPATERFNQAMDQRRMCTWVIGAGGVLAIVGAVLSAFALFEKKYVLPVTLPQDRPPSST